MARRVEALGYRALGASPGEIEPALDRAPAAILLWAHEGEIRPLLARLRGHTAGEGIPVVLCGELGGEIRDLADVLELGADRFLVAPIDEDELRRTLVDLLGPAGAQPEAADGPVDPAEVATDPFGQSGHDPLLAQLRRTLADLDDATPSGDRDDLDLTAMGLGAVPRIDGETAELADLSLLAAPQPHGPSARPTATLRIPTDAAVSAVGPIDTIATDAEVSTALVARHRPSAAAATGELGDPPGIELFGRLHRLRFTGRARLEGPSAIDVWMVDGSPVHAEGSDPDDRLSAGLRRRGLLNAADAALLHQRLPHDTLADGDLLPAQAPLKPHEVADALADHLEELLLRAASWASGRWSLIHGEASPSLTRVTCSLGHVLQVGCALELAADAPYAALRPRERRPLRRAGADDELDPPPPIREWAAALDGRRTIDEVVAEDPRERLAWLRALVALGLVDLLPADGGDPAAIDRRRIEARLVDARRGDPLALLGVDADAPPLAIARAHRNLRRTFAPERLEPTTRERMAAALDELVAALDLARDVLLDAERRAAYLAGRED
ncbi:MAG: hypothetical protein R3B09_14800 [Nannocystaceae bacterium]